MFLDLPDLDQDPLVRGMDPDPAPDPDPSIIKQKNSKKNLDSYCFMTSSGLFILKNYVNVPSKTNKQKTFIKKIVFCWLLESQWQK
jgi:hypothetical protein